MPSHLFVYCTRMILEVQVSSSYQSRGRGPKRGAKQQRPTGKLARNQAVSVFGIGSIYELRFATKRGQVLNSVMIAGLDNWEEDPDLTFREPVLERALGVNRFQTPPAAADDDSSDAAFIPSVRFPEWMVCSKCDRLGKIPFEFSEEQYQPTCRANNCRGNGVPARLVTACFHSELDSGSDLQPGHIDDFPWAMWAHRGQRSCEKPQLKLLNTGGSAGLSGLEVRCFSKDCNGQVSNSLAGVFGEDALERFTCKGNRPWLGDKEEGCKRKVRVLMRGASNSYFPAVASALSIPPYSSFLLNRLGKVSIIFQSYESLDLSALVTLAKSGLAGIRDKYTDEQIGDAIVHLAEGESNNAPRTEDEQKQAERLALTQGSSGQDDKSEFEAGVLPVDELDVEISSHFDCLVKADRLREVRVLRGFSRVSSVRGGNAYATVCAPLSRSGIDWLPAIEIRGEGVYFELNSDAVEQWARRDSVVERHRTVEKNWQLRIEQGKGGDDEEAPSSGFVLVHTFCHLLMNELALECGYSSASLRERIYVGTPEDPYHGALIYTAMPGADGTLGGLASQAWPENFSSVVRRTLESAQWCSSDPLCIDSEGQGADALNQAACHACCLVSETSCETGNLFLDRALICGTDDKPDLSFFSRD